MTTHERTLEGTRARPRSLEVEQHPLTRSVVLHLVPGLATAAAFGALAPAWDVNGTPRTSP